MKYLETNPAFYKRAAQIALPVTLQNMITIGVNMLDSIMLGALGETPLSAASLGNQFITFFQICCMGIGMGVSVMTARFYGKGDEVSLKKSVTIALRFTLIFAAIFSLLAAFATKNVLGLYSPEENVVSAGAIYLKWSVPTFFLGGLSLVVTNILRSVNLAKISMFASLGAFFINLTANYAFIFGKLGAPRMEIAGAALGTVIARIFEFCVIVGYFLFFDKRIKYRIKNLFKKCSDLVGEYIKFGLPVLISDALLGFGTNVVAMIMGHVGAQFVSANAITMATQQLSTVFIQGLAFAGSIVTGHTLGEGRTEDAKRQGYTFFFLGSAVGCLAALVIMLIRGPIINAYNISAETKEITWQLMNAICIIVIFQSTNSILTKGVLRGGGDTKFLMVADILFLWVVSVPLGALAGLVWHLPPFWIYFCLKIDQIIKAVWCIFRLKSNKWIKKIKSASEVQQV